MGSEFPVGENIHLGHTAWLEQVAERTRYRKQCLGRRRFRDRVRVLVIDSDAGRSAHLVEQVHAIGSFETRRASTCDSALMMVDEFLPNVVLLNIDFPDLASYRLATTLRWRSSLIGMRLIALTSDIPAIDRYRALEAGFEQYLTIPAQHATLERVLRQSLQPVDPVRSRADGRSH